MLPANHPLFHTQLFASGAVGQLKPHVVTGCNVCPHSGMVATGIPPHLVMSNNLTAVVENTKALKTTLLSRCDELPAQLTNVMMSKFSINGAIPVTLADMTSLLDTRFAEMKTQLLSAQAVSAVDAPSHPNDDRFQLWTWGGMMHPVPADFKMPSANLKDIWYQWHYGNVAAKTRPLRFLSSEDLQSDAEVTAWSKTHKVIGAVAQMMVDMQLVASLRDVQTLAAAESMTFFDQAIVALMEKIAPGSTRQRTRWTEQCIPTLYEKLRLRKLLPEKQPQTGKSRKRKRQEQDREAGREQQQSV
jgi:hypothetical protein